MNIPKIPGLAEANILIAIGYGIFLIVGLLIYIAFIKDDRKRKKSKRRE